MRASAARDRLIVAHRPLCRLVAKGVYQQLNGAAHGNVDLDDLIGWGYVGLVKAAERWNRSRGVRFASYARHKIRGAILDNYRGRMYWADAGSAPLSEHSDVPAVDNQEAAVFSREASTLASELISALPDHLARVIRLRYGGEGMSLRSVGAALGVSDSRVCQLHAKAIVIMRQEAAARSLKAEHVSGDMQACPSSVSVIRIQGKAPWSRSRSTPTTPAGARSTSRFATRPAA